MMDTLVVLPLLIPLVTAVASLLVWHLVAVQRWLAVLGAAALLAAGAALLTALHRGDGIHATQLGDWKAPYGITLVADLLSAVMIVLAGSMAIVVAIYSLANIDRRRESFGYYPLFHLLLMGVCGAFLTGDIFNLYVWFEVMLMASFVLMALGGERAQLRGAIKYVTLNLLASAVFLAAVGILYGFAGTLNMADLAEKLTDERAPAALVTTISMLFLIAFGVKAALFPLFFWLPASYHTPPVAVTAIFAGLLTKVGVYALVRMFTLVFVRDIDYTHGLILLLSGLTMVTGVLGAAAQNEFRRILAFHSVSQIGYMVMGLGLFGLAASSDVKAYALAGAILFMLHHSVVKTNLFLVSGLVERLTGSFELKRLGGLYASRPGVALLFLIPAMSLAGMPPLSGFFAKLALVRAGLSAEQYAIVAAALFTGLLTLFSMVKIWAEVFWKQPPQQEKGDGGLLRLDGLASEQSNHSQKTRDPGRFDRSAALLLGVPIVVLVVATIAMGIAAEPLFDLLLQAAEQLLDRELYIHTVLEARR